MRKIQISSFVIKNILSGFAVFLILSAGFYFWGLKLPCPRSTSTRVLLIGIDGATWKIINPLLAEGRLPNLERLLKKSAYGRIKSIEPMVSPALWTTIATGKTFEKHGIDSFVETPSGLSDFIPVTSNLRKCKAIWNILTKENKRSIVIDYYVTYPPEQINGIMISRVDYCSEWAKYRKKSRAYPDYPCMTHPPEVEGMVGAIVSGLKAQRPFLDSLDILESVVDKFITEKWDFFALYTRVLDEREHLYWKYMEPEKFKDPRWHVNKEGVRRFKDYVKGIYVRVDLFIGSLLSRADKDTVVIIVSDHGMKAAATYDSSNVFDSGVHDLDDGVIIMTGKDIKKGAHLSNASVLDVTPTILYLFGLPVAKDMDGKVLLDGITSVRAEKESVQYIETYDPPGLREKKESPVRSPFDKEIIKRLKSLGYLQ